MLLAHEEYRTGDLEQADALAREAEELAASSGDRKATLRVMRLRAYIDAASGHPARGLARLEQRLVEEEGKLSPSDRILLFINLSALAYRLGDYEAAQRHARDAVTALRKRGGKRTRCSALVNLAAASCDRGDLQEALDALDQALPLADSLTPDHRRALRVERAALLCEIGRAGVGARELRALSQEETGEAPGAWFCLGILYLETGDGDISHAFEEAISGMKEPSYAVSLGQAFGALARARIGVGDLSGAEESLAGIPQRTLGCLAVRRERDHAAALLARARGDHAGTREQLLAALQTAARQGARIRQVELLLDLARLESSAGDEATAEAHTVAAVATVAAIARDLREPRDRASFLARPLFAPVHERLVTILKED